MAPMGSALLCVGDGIAPGHYRLHSRFSRVSNFVADDGSLVAIVTCEVGTGPVNVVLDGPGDWPWESLDIALEHLVLHRRADRPDAGSYRGGPDEVLVLPVSSEVRRDTRLERLPAADLGPGALHLAIARVLEQALPPSLACLLRTELAGPNPGAKPAASRDAGGSAFERALAERARAGARLLAGADFLGCARLLRGCGYGLTPSGDDFNTGLLAALWLLEQPDLGAVHAAARGQNVLSNAFLDQAIAGRLNAAPRAFVQAVVHGEQDAREASDRLLAVGATSGADFAAGFLLTWRSLLESLSAPGATTTPSG